MSMIRCRRLVVLVFCGSLAPILLSHAWAQEKATNPPIPAQLKPPSIATYPQIVRIRWLEGDVRVTRGKESEKASGSTWEKAVAGLPLATGFSLVTSAGRAEIEFEDASTVYLAENSALAFNDIHTTAGIPFTSIALLSGTATLHVKLTVPAFFRLLTPTGSMIARYPEETYARVTSFTDATEITFLTGMRVDLSGSMAQIRNFTKGQTLVDHGNGRVSLADPNATHPMAAWDAWVDQRVTERTQAEADMMKASGLTAPIPGLADMEGQGSFFECAPYGTCWEPTAASGAEQAGGEMHETQAAVTPRARMPLAAGSQAPVSTAVAQSPEKAAAPVLTVAEQAPGAAPAVHPTERFERLDFFPCSPDAIRTLVKRDRVTGKERVLWSRPESWQAGYFGFGDPYDWAVCHAGFWIYHRNHYVWVVGHKRHHRSPIRWVKQGRDKAYVPLHPRDVTGKRPENLRHGAFVVGSKGQSVERMMLNPDREVKVLDSAPKEFTKPHFEALAKADDPRVEVHRLSEPHLAGKSAGPVLAFDRKSQSFLLARQVTQGNKTTTEMTPFNGMRGNLQARVEGTDAHGNYSTRSYSGGSGGFAGGGGGGGARGGSYSGSAGGGSRGGGYSGGVSAGGGSHGGGSSDGGGGFSGGGGGGSHGGGGGGFSGGGGSAGGGGSSGGGGGGHH